MIYGNSVYDRGILFDAANFSLFFLQKGDSVIKVTAVLHDFPHFG
jgi:hypothetical protein